MRATSARPLGVYLSRSVDVKPTELPPPEIGIPVASRINERPFARQTPALASAAPRRPQPICRRRRRAHGPSRSARVASKDDCRSATGHELRSVRHGCATGEGLPREASEPALRTPHCGPASVCSAAAGRTNLLRTSPARWTRPRRGQMSPHDCAAHPAACFRSASNDACVRFVVRSASCATPGDLQQRHLRRGHLPRSCKRWSDRRRLRRSLLPPCGAGSSGERGDGWKEPTRDKKKDFSPPLFPFPTQDCVRGSWRGGVLPSATLFRRTVQWQEGESMRARRRPP